MKTSKLVKWLCVVIAASHLAACATAPNFGTPPPPPSSSGPSSGAIIAGVALLVLAVWLLNRGKQEPEAPVKEGPPAESQPQATNLPSF